MLHSDDDIPLFVSCFDIPVRLGSLRQRIAPIDDRFDLPLLNKLSEENQIFNSICDPKYDFPSDGLFSASSWSFSGARQSKATRGTHA
jgi:hypothetical protein